MLKVSPYLENFVQERHQMPSQGSFPLIGEIFLTGLVKKLEISSVLHAKYILSYIGI